MTICVVYELFIMGQVRYYRMCLTVVRGNMNDNVDHKGIGVAHRVKSRCQT